MSLGLCEYADRPHRDIIDFKNQWKELMKEEEVEREKARIMRNLDIHWEQ